MQGIFVHPGVIDADFTGQICAMVSTPTLPVTIPEKTRIAELVPFKLCVPRTEQRTRGEEPLDPREHLRFSGSKTSRAND